MARYLLDTGLVIRHLRGQRKVVRVLRGLGKEGRLSISAITRLEVRAGMVPEERYATQKLLSRFVTCEVDSAVADRAGDLIARKRAEGITITIAVPDAIIAATAIQQGLSLVTLNPAHFIGLAGLSLFPWPEAD
jgi:predicted nucleic acid-binding protein